MNNRKMLEAMAQQVLPEARTNVANFAALDAKMQDRFLNNLAPAAMQKLRNDINLVIKHDKVDFTHLDKLVGDKQIEAANLQAQANAAVVKAQQEQAALREAARNQPAEIKQTKADYAAFMVMRDDPKLQAQDKNMDKLMDGLLKDSGRLSRLESEITRRNPDPAKAKSIMDSLQAAKEKLSLPSRGNDKISSENIEGSLTKSGLTRSG